MEKKQYRTRGKARLLQYLASSPDPKTAGEICAALSAGTDVPGQSSVYRMLADLSARGEVRRYRLPAPATGYAYQYVGDTHYCDSHFHLHCVGCGSITHLECDCGAEIAKRLRESHGFSTDCARTVFYGMCADCTKRGRTV